MTGSERPGARRPAVPVRKIRRPERNEVVAVAARAFWDDPLFSFFARDPLSEHRLLPNVFGVFLGEMWAVGAPTWVAPVDDRPRGVACWLPPGVRTPHFPRNPLRLARMAATIGRARHRGDVLALLDEVERARPEDPHWYLGVLATDPSTQGRGLGTAMIAPVLSMCDAEGLPAYLETQTEANVSWYARSGFEVVREIRQGGAPPVWCLRREPVPPAPPATTVR